MPVTICACIVTESVWLPILFDPYEPPSHYGPFDIVQSGDVTIVQRFIVFAKVPPQEPPCQR